MTKKIILKKSKIHGTGIFANKDIKKGETVLIIRGHKIFQINKNKKDSFNGPDWIGIDKNKWIDPIIPAKKLNHSCNPNSGIKGKVKVVAIDDIKKDEEITIDYSITEIDNFWYMKCSCGSHNCRKEIRSVQFLPKRIYNKYNPNIPTFSKKIYESENLSKS